MKLTDQLTDYINAAMTGLWVQTHEADEAERAIVHHAHQKNWKIAVWDMAAGLRIPGNTNQPSQETGNTDPLSPLRALPALADPAGTAVLVLHNYHRFLNNPEVIQTVFSQLIAGKQQRTFIVVLSPLLQVPVELEKLFVVLEHALPDREELTRIARELVSDQPQDFPQGEHLQKVLDAATGLTRYEAEGAFALSLTRFNNIRPESIWELKSQALKKNNLLTLHRGNEDFASLGGLSNLKDFCLRALRPGRRVRARGVLLLSPPGCGKSQFCKALGNEIGRPTLIVDVGSLFGSLVGSTEANVRQALRVIDAMAPCVAFIDEVEKALAGLGGVGDSGVSTRMFGTILTWLSDHESDVFVVATANDISKLPPEFARAERWDGCFFVDLPTTSEKELIWAMYRQHFDIPESQVRPDDRGWTGAEIRACCRLATLLEVPLIQAANNVVPVSVTAAESVERLRTWASGRCLDASGSGVYSREVNTKVKPSRRVQRGPSDN